MVRGDSWISRDALAIINAASPVKRGQGTNKNGRTIAETGRHLIRAVACATTFLGDRHAPIMGLKRLSAVAWCWKNNGFPWWRLRMAVKARSWARWWPFVQPTVKPDPQLVVLIFLSRNDILFPSRRAQSRGGQR